MTPRSRRRGRDRHRHGTVVGTSADEAEAGDRRELIIDLDQRQLHGFDRPPGPARPHAVGHQRPPPRSPDDGFAAGSAALHGQRHDRSSAVRLDRTICRTSPTPQSTSPDRVVHGCVAVISRDFAHAACAATAPRRGGPARRSSSLEAIKTVHDDALLVASELATDAVSCTRAWTAMANFRFWPRSCQTAYGSQ